jgi:hypothetical protein
MWNKFKSAAKPTFGKVPQNLWIKKCRKTVLSELVPPKKCKSVFSVAYVVIFGFCVHQRLLGGFGGCCGDCCDCFLSPN